MPMDLPPQGLPAHEVQMVLETDEQGNSSLTPFIRIAILSWIALPLLAAAVIFGLTDAVEVPLMKRQVPFNYAKPLALLLLLATGTLLLIGRKALATLDSHPRHWRLGLALPLLNYMILLVLWQRQQTATGPRRQIGLRLAWLNVLAIVGCATLLWQELENYQDYTLRRGLHTHIRNAGQIWLACADEKLIQWRPDCDTQIRLKVRPVDREWVELVAIRGGADGVGNRVIFRRQIGRHRYSGFPVLLRFEREGDVPRLRECRFDAEADSALGGWFTTVCRELSPPPQPK